MDYNSDSNSHEPVVYLIFLPPFLIYHSINVEHDCKTGKINRLCNNDYCTAVSVIPTLGGISPSAFVIGMRKSGPAPMSERRLTIRSSGRVGDKVPSSYAGARAAQLNR